MGDFFISPQTRAQHAPTGGMMNVSMDFNAAPSGTARGTEVIIPDNASPAVRAAAEQYNAGVAAFALQNGIADYPVRGVRTRSENGRGVANTIHAEPFFNSDSDMQMAIRNNPGAFAEIYRTAFGSLPNTRLIAPHGVGADRGAASDYFTDETSFGELMANSLLGNPYELAAMASGPQATVSTRNAPTGGILSNEGNQMDRQPQGLLGSMGIQRRDPTAQGETSQPFYNRQSFGDTLARLAPALGRMGVMGLEGPAQAALDSRNERQGDERAQQAQAARANQTIEWLRSNGREDLAGAVQSGGLPIGEAMSMAMAPAAEPVRGINVDGNLVNPVTGELMFEAGNGGASPSSAIAKLQADLSAGLINQEQYDLGLSNMAPSGMRIVSDGLGGFTMEQGSAVGAEDGRMSPSDPQAMVDSIDGILNDPALDRSTGLFSAMQNIPGTDQYRFGTRARQLEGQAFLQAFESLKGAGQITEVEGLKATQAIGRLDTAQQADDYREALNDLRSILTTAQARGAAMQSPDGNAAAPAGARIRYDAEGNRL